MSDTDTSEKPKKQRLHSFKKVHDFVMEMVCDRSLPKAATTIGCLLVSHYMDAETGRIDPGHGRLKQETGFDIPTIRMSVRRLTQYGYFRVEHRPKKPGQHDTNLYTPVFDPEERTMWGEVARQDRIARKDRWRSRRDADATTPADVPNDLSSDNDNWPAYEWEATGTDDPPF